MSGSASEGTGRAAVVTACTQAANVWFSTAEAGQRWRLVAELHAVVALAHLVHEGSLLPLVKFAGGLSGPLADLLPRQLREDCDQVDLAEDGCLSAAAADLLMENLAPSMAADRVAELPWHALNAEKIQGWLYGQLLASGTQQGYVDARLAVIRHAAGEMVSIMDVVKQAGLPRDGLYEHIPGWAWVLHEGERYWFGCPLCRWPMRFQLGRLACAYRPHEQFMGGPVTVRCTRGAPPHVGGGRRERVAALGGQPEIAASRVEGHVSLVRPVWRYSTIPGCEEWHLTERLRALPGVEVQLWPHTDAFDLLVEVKNRRRAWRVDVKDYTDPGRLAAELLRRGDVRGKDMLIVVPDHRRDQVRLLNERLQAGLGQPKRTFAMRSSRLLAVVRAAANAQAVTR